MNWFRNLFLLLTSLVFLGIALNGSTGFSATKKPKTIETPTEVPSESIVPSVPVQPSAEPLIKLDELCVKSLKPFAGKFDEKILAQACAKVELMPDCHSVEQVPIFHYNKAGIKKDAANILVMSLIHGDETPAGSVGRFWMERLESIEPRNSWRVIPILNPDGVKRKTRTNANKVDINRNFPTKDWSEKALLYWERDTMKNPRRFPGLESASEPETKCAVKHIEDFKPDFIVSIHTPLKVLDYDGPKVKPPKFDYLPWKSLGHFPGSIGRYMWSERKIPVLTMELKEDLPNSNDPWIQLQDIIGFLVGLEHMKAKEIKEIQK